MQLQLSHPIKTRPATSGGDKKMRAQRMEQVADLVICEEEAGDTTQVNWYQWPPTNQSIH